MKPMFIVCIRKCDRCTNCCEGEIVRADSKEEAVELVRDEKIADLFRQIELIKNATFSCKFHV